MIKKIFVYWEQGIKNSPKIVKECIIRIKLKNPTWEIIYLDNNNINKYIDINKEIPNIKNKNIRKSHYADIVRLFLLDKYGGCWCDATLYFNKPLDDWLPKYISKGFFAFNKPALDRLISNWFLYSQKNNYIIKKWKEKIINYWKNNNEILRYYTHHDLFKNLYNTDNKFKNMWNSVPKINADYAHCLQSYGLTTNISDKFIKNIDKSKSPIYKLSYNYDKKKYNDNCALAYLIKKNQLKFQHIPKTGGTSIEYAALKNNLEWGRFDTNLISNKNITIPWHCPQKINCFSFCVIRNPYKKFISQFYHENDPIYYNKIKLNKFIKEKLNIITKDIHHENNHYLYQYKFYKHCDIAICYKDLQLNMDKLSKLFNLPILKLDNFYGGNKQQSKRKECKFKKLKVDDIDKENQNSLYEFYKKDFDLYYLVKKNSILIK